MRCVACSYLRRTYLIAGVSSHFNKESTPLVPVLTHTCASWKSNLGEFHSQRQDQRGSAKPAKRAVAKLGRNLQEHRAIFNLISNIARPSQLQPQRLSPPPPPRSIAISTQAGRHTEYPPVTAARLLRRLSPRPREAPLLRPQQTDFHATSARLCQRRGFQLHTQCVLVLLQAPRPPRLSPLKLN